jgi:hypothetical protein
MTGHRRCGRTDPDPAVNARAEALFQRKQEQKREGQSATDDYQAGQKAERAKMAKLRALRLAAEAKAGVKATAAPGKAKRS